MLPDTFYKSTLTTNFGVSNPVIKYYNALREVISIRGLPNISSNNELVGRFKKSGGLVEAE